VEDGGGMGYTVTVNNGNGNDDGDDTGNDNCNAKPMDQAASSPTTNCASPTDSYPGLGHCPATIAISDCKVEVVGPTVLCRRGVDERAVCIKRDRAALHCGAGDAGDSEGVAITISSAAAESGACSNHQGSVLCG